ncbi:MAG: TolC family protein, partial [Gemmatimonadota bacterium]|nr:TolC family protein [Gemmatimonadota bacterium]
VAYTGAGVQRIGTLDFGAQSTDWYSSSYSLNVSWTLNGSTLFGLSSARADREAVEARVDAAAFDLESQVALRYMAALRARDGVDVARRQLERAEQNAQLVQGRVATGAAPGTDGKQSEVDLGRAQVEVIQAERIFREAQLMLMEQVGLSLGEGVDLVSEFQVFEPDWDRDELLAQALGGNPSLSAAEAQVRASRASLRQARSSYFPSLTVSTGLSGNALQALNEDFLVTTAESRVGDQAASCRLLNDISSGLSQPLAGYPQDCSGLVFTDRMRAELLAQNDAFPFDVTKNPLSLRLTLSIPVFTGFARQRQVAEASAAAHDAEHSRRAEDLRLRTAVTQAFDNLVSAFRVVALEERNRGVAEEQLQLQQRRYALGAAPLLELLDAQTSMSTAEQAYLNARYDFHWNLIRLEAAVGRPLRTR